MYLTCITITQSTIITNPIGFNIGLTNVDARLKQRCINVVPTLCNVVLTLCNVVLTLFQRRTLTLYQRCATLKIRRRILFHFQRRINVISTLIHNVETTLIRRWNVGWVRLELSDRYAIRKLPLKQKRFTMFKNSLVALVSRLMYWLFLIVFVLFICYFVFRLFLL